MPLIARTVAERALIPLGGADDGWWCSCWCCGGRRPISAALCGGNLRRNSKVTACSRAGLRLPHWPGWSPHAPPARKTFPPHRHHRSALSGRRAGRRGGAADRAARRATQAIDRGRQPRRRRRRDRQRRGRARRAGRAHARARHQPDPRHQSEPAEKLPVRCSEGFCAGRGLADIPHVLAARKSLPPTTSRSWWRRQGMPGNFSTARPATARPRISPPSCSTARPASTPARAVPRRGADDDGADRRPYRRELRDLAERHRADRGRRIEGAGGRERAPRRAAAECRRRSRKPASPASRPTPGSPCSRRRARRQPPSSISTARSPRRSRTDCARCLCRAGHDACAANAGRGRGLAAGRGQKWAAVIKAAGVVVE